MALIMFASAGSGELPEGGRAAMKPTMERAEAGSAYKDRRGDAGCGREAHAGELADEITELISLHSPPHNHPQNIRIPMHDDFENQRGGKPAGEQGNIVRRAGAKGLLQGTADRVEFGFGNHAGTFHPPP